LETTTEHGAVAGLTQTQQVPSLVKFGAQH
jgi:hypothetical protein